MAPRHIGRIVARRNVRGVIHQTMQITKKCTWLMCGVFLVLFLFSVYRSEYIIETMRHAVTRAAAPDDPSNSFECLANDGYLWGMRRDASKQHALAICQTSSPVIEFDVVVPVIVVTWDAAPVPIWEFKRPAFHHMITTALNTAAEFNDRVILLNMGSPNRYTLHPHVDTVYADTFLRYAMNSFDSPLYQHNSPNGFMYELTCFQRWFAIAALMQQKNIPRIFVMDVDVLLFVNITMQVEQCFPGCRTVGHGCYSTYMTQDDVVAFTVFIIKYFERGDFRTELAEFGVVSDMILHLRWQQSIQIEPHCTLNIFEGSFVADFAQDLLGMPYQSKSGHRTQTLHFAQGFRKAVLEYCRSYY